MTVVKSGMFFLYAWMSYQPQKFCITTLIVLGWLSQKKKSFMVLALKLHKMLFCKLCPVEADALKASLHYLVKYKCKKTSMLVNERRHFRPSSWKMICTRLHFVGLVSVDMLRVQRCVRLNVSGLFGLVAHQFIPDCHVLFSTLVLQSGSLSLIPGRGRGGGHHPNDPPQSVPGSSRGVAGRLWRCLLARCPSGVIVGRTLEHQMLDRLVGAVAVWADGRVPARDPVKSAAVVPLVVASCFPNLLQ